MIGSVEPEICTEMLRTLTEKLGAKLPATTRSYSMVKFPHLDDAFLVFFFFLNWEQAQQKVDYCSKKTRKVEKGKMQKLLRKPKAYKRRTLGHFLVQKLEILVSSYARAKIS